MEGPLQKRLEALLEKPTSALQERIELPSASSAEAQLIEAVMTPQEVSSPAETPFAWRWFGWLGGALAAACGLVFVLNANILPQPIWQTNDAGNGAKGSKCIGSKGSLPCRPAPSPKKRLQLKLAIVQEDQSKITPISSGASCPSSERLAFFVRLVSPGGYFYLFAKETSGEMSLLYPSSSTNIYLPMQNKGQALKSKGNVLTLPLQGIKGPLQFIALQVRRPLSLQALRRWQNEPAWRQKEWQRLKRKAPKEGWFVSSQQIVVQP